MFILTIYKEKVRKMKQRVKINERQLTQIVSESVKRILNEMSLHNIHSKSTYDPNAGSWAPEGKDWKWAYDGDKNDRYLWRMKKDAENDGCVGPHRFPMASWFGKNAYSYFRYIGEYSGECEHVPYITNPEDDYEMTPEDMYRAIDELNYGNQMGYENHRDFGNDW